MKVLRVSPYDPYARMSISNKEKVARQIIAKSWLDMRETDRMITASPSMREIIDRIANQMLADNEV